MAPADELPPSDFDAHPLPIDTLEPGVHLYRTHPLEYDPVYFSVGHSGNRYDDPDGQYGVCYLALSAEGAFVETFLRQRRRGFVDEAELSRRGLSQLEVTAPIRVARFHSTGLAKMGATAAVTSGPTSVAQRWAAALFRHPDGVQGIAYRVRHDDEQIGVALFEHEEPPLKLVTTTPWDDRSILEAMCERYELRL